MPATVIITKNKNAAVSVENLRSGNVELALESKKVLAGGEVESVRAVFTREELTGIRDAINESLIAF